VCRKGCAEVRIGGDGGVPDPVDRGQRVPDPDGVQSALFPRGEHSGVHLQVQMPVGVPGPGGVVPHRYRLEHLKRHLHLSTAWADPGGGVLVQPAEDLAGGQSCAASYAAAISGCSAAARDHDFGPFTTTSTKRTAQSPSRSRPRGTPVSGSRPATHAS
jgi:hypothetical protein